MYCIRSLEKLSLEQIVPVYKDTTGVFICTGDA